MKKLLPILFVLIITSCSPPPEVPSDQLVERDGIYYEINSTKPFNGLRITNEEEYGLGLSKDGFTNGLPNGFMEVYDLSDRLMFRFTNDLNLVFHENGQVKSKSIIKNDMYHGLQESYDINGVLVGQTCWENGEKVDMSLCKK